jgi:hypothetical protein
MLLHGLVICISTSTDTKDVLQITDHPGFCFIHGPWEFFINNIFKLCHVTLNDRAIYKRRTRKEEDVAYLRYYTGICLRELRKVTVKLGQDN